jgi:phage-related tail fiber protein
LTTSFFAGFALNANQTATVEGLITELRNNDWKQSCRAASTADVTVSSAPASMDGVTFTVGDRLLLKDQTDASENGIYTFVATGSALVRATDCDVDEEVSSGLTVIVTEGTTNIQKIFTITDTDPLTVGTSDLTFQHYTGAKGTAIQISGMLETPTAKDYTLIPKNRAVFTGDEIYLKTATGTCLATVEVNGSPVAGLTSIAVNSTGVTATPSSTMTVAVNDRITLVLSTIAGATDLEFDLKGTRS